MEGNDTEIQREKQTNREGGVELLEKQRNKEGGIELLVLLQYQVHVTFII